MNTLADPKVVSTGLLGGRVRKALLDKQQGVGVWHPPNMIIKHSHSTVYVLDQERAKTFYTEKLGLEVRDDVRLGNFRWLTVAPKTQPDACIVLMAVESSPMMDGEDVEAVRGLLAKGALGGGVLQVDDCHQTYAELKAKGVTFLSEPKEMPYGIEALLRDDSGNFFSMTQRR